MSGERILSCQIEPQQSFVCGESVTCSFIFRLQEPLLPGGSIRLFFTQSPYYRLPPAHGLPGKGFIFYARTQFQTEDPRAPGYLTVQSPAGRAVRIQHRPGECFVTLQCDHGLEPDDEVTLIAGNRSGGGPGIEIVHHPSYGDWPLVCEVDCLGSGTFVRQRGMPSLCVVPAAAADVRVQVPSQTLPGAGTELQLTVIDRFGNPVEGYQGRFRLQMERDETPAKDALQLRAEDGGIRRFSDTFVLNEKGIERLVIEGGTTDARLHGVSNPVVCLSQQEKHQLFWGDLHGHSYCSDGTHSPAFYYDYGRSAGFLDFCALTDHDTFSHEIWQEMMATAEQAYRPGEFTTFLGYEWQGAFDQTIVVYFKRAAGGYYPGREVTSRIPGDLMRLLMERDGSENVMVVRHDMPPKGQRWPTIDSSSGLERLVEIYSPFHTSEAPDAPDVRGNLDAVNCIQAALANGFRFGFVACSDTHLSMPGRRRSGTKGSPGYQTRAYGLTAVYATENNREAIFQALRARRCYAATDRIVLDFRIDGHRMGEEVRLGEPRHVYIRASGTAPFAQIDLVKNNRTIHRTGQGQTDAEFETIDRTPIEPGDYYYFRVVQTDGGMAWTSPVWIDPD